MTPATPATEVANALATKAPGERVVHLSGFAGDITSYDAPKAGAGATAAPIIASISSPAAATPSASPSTGLSVGAAASAALPTGTATVHERVKDSMTELRDAGAKVDAFTVETPATLPAGRVADAVLATAVDAAVKEVYPDAKAPVRTGASGAEGGISSEGGIASSSQGGSQSGAPQQAQDPNAAEIEALSKLTVANARTALAALDQQRLPEWGGNLRYRGVDWDRIIALSLDSPSMRSTLFAFVQAADQIVATDPSRYRRPATLAQIAPDMVDPLSVNAGPNREARALAMADCTQADFLRSKGLTLAIAARYGNNPAHLAKAIEILTAVTDWMPFQRPGWSLADPTRTMPAGGDGVNMATAWGINGVIDMLDVLGDRVPADLRQRLMMCLRREVAAIVDSWAFERPWYVKSDTANSNQWIDPSAALMKACLFIGDQRLMPAYQLGAENVARSLAMSGRDGAFLEGVSYAQMSLGPLFDVLIAARGTGDDRFAAFPFVDKSWRWFIHMLMPSGILVNCSDSRMSMLPAWAIRAPLESMELAALASREGTALSTMRSLFPESSQTVAGLRFAAALAAPAPGGGSAAPAIDPWGSYPSQQLVTWRESLRGPADSTQDLAVWVKGGSPDERSHGHRDQGQVSVQLGRRVILMDCGTPDYSDPDLISRYSEAAGHGIMQVGQVRPHQQAVNAPVEVISLGAGGGHVRADTSAAYAPGTQCTREVSWATQGRVTISDSATLPSAVPAGTEIYRFHTGSAQPLTITGSGSAWTVSWAGAQMSIQADRAITVDQVQWPDAVRAPFVHQAVIIRSADATSQLAMTTVVEIDRSAGQ